MEPSLPAAADHDALWDWNNLLDFDVTDDPLILPWELSPPAEPSAAVGEGAASPEGAAVGASGSRVRKRDPRLVCPNYLAGRVPCACPEMDAMEMDAAEAEKADSAALAVEVKRRRTRVKGAPPEVRCQVPGCEVDIRELKGYHRRHRVCLRCANAASVVLEGTPKRYCQQCGKFHVLSDFDEGKRSCRRKLERHNKRRRRRPDSKSILDTDLQNQPDSLVEVVCDDEQMEGTPTKGFCESDEAVHSSRVVDQETTICSDDGYSSPTCTLPSSQNDRSNSVASATCAEGSLEDKIEFSKLTHLSDQKTVYSSMCPTGRISFKLYDWNPAEFPRRLRNQVLQWLGSMPVELEGYIRPGCTILTIFLAMPQTMWDKLSKYPEHLVRDLVVSPNSVLMKKGQFYIYLCNRMFKIMEDGTSVMNIMMDIQAPRIHHVHPLFVDIGKPIELVLCGSYLDQPKFKSLVSFGGKYLEHVCTRVPSHRLSCTIEDSMASSSHETYKLCVTESGNEFIGPAFIEVENVSGLSNFVPILFANEQICSELKRMECALCKPFHAGSLSGDGLPASTLSCENLRQTQSTVSALLLDIAWILRSPSPAADGALNRTNIERLSCLLKFLMQNEFFSILEMVLHSLDSHIGHEVNSNLEQGSLDEGVMLFLDYVRHAKSIVRQRARTDSISEPHRTVSHDAVACSESPPSCSQTADVLESREDSYRTSAAAGEEEHAALLTESFPRRWCRPQFGAKQSRGSSPALHASSVKPRLAVTLVVAIVVCFAVCAALLHPHRGQIAAVSVKRYLVWQHRR